MALKMLPFRIHSPNVVPLSRVTSHLMDIAVKFYNDTSIRAKKLSLDSWCKLAMETALFYGWKPVEIYRAPSSRSSTSRGNVTESRKRVRFSM